MDSLDLIYIKLATGKELVGELVERTDHEIQLRKPMTISIIEKRGIGFFQLSQYSYATDIVGFNSRFVVESGVAVKQLVNLYVRYYDEPMEDLSEETLNEFIDSEFPDADPEEPTAEEFLENLSTILKGNKRQVH